MWTRQILNVIMQQQQKQTRVTGLRRQYMLVILH